MKVEFSRKFSQDLDKITVKSVKQSLIKIIEFLEKADTLENFPGIKKLKGHRSAYRIRIGDYRLGLFYEKGIILLARFLNRKDIYKSFP